MMLAACPEETELLAVANGEPAGGDLHAHVESCDACRKQIARFRSSIDELRGVAESFDLGQIRRVEPDPATPTQIGRYRVLDVLDRGGQAWVYRVLHPTIKKEMVLKLSRYPIPPGETESGRMVTEARVLAELDHPAIARVYDLDFCREAPFEGHAFIVMEWVPGRTLYQYAKDHPIGWREAALLVAQVARAAAEAHRRGITHRDITHRNILIDDTHHPRLIDFGLARLGSVWATTTEPTGTIAGTPDFMAPEQAEARLDEIGPRTDVYALGAVLRTVLGLPDDAGKTTELMGVSARGGGTRGGAARSSQTLPRLGPDAGRVPEAMRKVIGKATQREPGDRYQNADELAAALENVAKPRSWKWAPSAITGVVGAGVIALALVLWLRPPPLPPSVPALADVLHVSDREPLTSYLPLSASREVYVSTEVPKGLTPVLVTIDPDGTVELPSPGLSQAASDDPQFDRWESWRNTHAHIKPGDPSGTKFVLVCARKQKMTDADAAALLADLRAFAHQAWLSGLPPQQLIRMGSMEHGVQAEVTRGFDAAPVEGQTAVQRLQELRQHLLDGGYTFFAGEAFPYIQDQPATQPEPGK